MNFFFEFKIGKLFEKKNKVLPKKLDHHNQNGNV